MDIFGQLQHFFLSGNTKTFQHRQAALNSLKKTLLKSKQEILQAAKKDFSRSEAEVFAAELAKIFQEIDFTLKHLRTWLKPQKTYSSCFGLRSKGYIYHEPYGVVLIIASWNFPFLLSLVPLIHALAAGNCAIVKPSELAPAQAAVIENIIKKSFNSSFVSVVQGDAQITQQLLTFPFDYIFFTGSSKVGALVYQKAAQQLIPVTLELGGKNPTIVTQDTDISYAAQKIAWGKFYAAGQCCLAPDYVLVDESVKEQFINFLKKYVLDFYGPDPAHNNGYTHIVTTQHINRLKKLLADGTIVVGGQIDVANKFMAPTIITDVSLQSCIMQEEIFGPILPVIPYKNIEDALSIIKKKPKSLAMYLFCSRKDIQEKFLHEISTGGCCINNVLVHHSPSTLPFGGVGTSGFGAYHGKFGFDTFSHKKTTLISSGWFNKLFVFPPYPTWCIKNPK